MNRVGKLNTTLSMNRVVGLVMIGSNALSSRSETLNLKDRFAEFAHPPPYTSDKIELLLTCSLSHILK
nr:hypothetical protein [Leptospira interrogans]